VAIATLHLIQPHELVKFATMGIMQVAMVVHGHVCQRARKALLLLEIHYVEMVKLLPHTKRVMMGILRMATAVHLFVYAKVWQNVPRLQASIAAETQL